MQSATIPPPEYFFKEVMFTKLKTVSYQDPSKIADGLSYIWDESHKWVKIANAMGTTDDALKRDLRLIATRRNSIVHEADLDPVTHLKLDVDAPTIITNSNFLEACGDAIENLVS